MLDLINPPASGAARPKGLRSISSGDGGSVASASAPMESMIMLTHSSGTNREGHSEQALVRMLEHDLTSIVMLLHTRGGEGGSRRIFNDGRVIVLNDPLAAARGSSETPAQAEMKLRLTATTLTTSWNCRNLRMDWNTLRPHSTAAQEGH